LLVSFFPISKIHIFIIVKIIEEQIMEITKVALQHILDSMPEKADIEEIFDKILISAKIDQALDQLEKGEYLTSKQLDEEIKKWD